jgi:hypothetical protein
VIEVEFIWGLPSGARQIRKVQTVPRVGEDVSVMGPTCALAADHKVVAVHHEVSRESHKIHVFIKRRERNV